MCLITSAVLDSVRAIAYICYRHGYRQMLTLLLRSLGSEIRISKVLNVGLTFKLYTKVNISPKRTNAIGARDLILGRMTAGWS